MASLVNFGALHCFLIDSEIKPWFRVRVQSLGGGDSTIWSSDSIVLNETSLTVNKENSRALIDGGTGEKEKSEALVDGGNWRLNSRVEKERVKDVVSKELEVLWDDGYGTKTVKHYLVCSKEMIRPDGGPPRWFCPAECGQPLNGSPILMFLPGLDGVGLGLTLHHKALGKVFEVWCLHSPVHHQTPFESLSLSKPLNSSKWLVKFAEETVRIEHASSPHKLIYLVGESFGGCLALAIAACNPKIDLVVILANSGTSFGRSQLQPLLPILEALPDGFYNAFPYLLGFVTGNPLKMAMVDIESRLPLRLQIEQLSRNLIALLNCLSVRNEGLADIMPKDTFLWKLKLLKSAAAYANSRLHAVKAEVLVLASGKDYMLPSGDEAQCLKSSLLDCTIRYFNDNGHNILMEDGINLLTIIKGTRKCRRLRKFDYVSDFLPPNMSEFKYAFDEMFGLLCFAAGSAVFSTLDDVKIVRGLSGVPNEGPVLLVGYHMLLGLEFYSLAEEFLREKNIMVCGVAHPDVFSGKLESSSAEFSFHDWLKVMGAVPVTASNLFKLFSTKAHVLLYPVGPRESLHYKGEAYKVFWPDQPEFVRMAARFGAKIVPFGTAGKDELALDYHDLVKIAMVEDYMKELNSNATKIRDDSKGEVASQELFMPVVQPKVPGRFYFLFGKPIETKGREDLHKDRGNANQLSLQIKSEVEHNMAYLLKKREEDPYRNVIDRIIYGAFYSPLLEVPAFGP